MKHFTRLRYCLTGGLAALFCTCLAASVPGAAPLPAGGANFQVTVPTPPPTVALTFDDGPRADTTQRLLDALALREVQATFFLVGECIPGNEALVRRMAQEGHQIGVHSYSHIRITGLSNADFDFEVGQVRTQLTAILGSGSYWLRPPYGITDTSVRRRADSPVILWSVDPEDWKDGDVQRIASAVLSQVRDGDIILFHDIYDSSVDAAIQVVDALLEQGASFLTVEQLMLERNVTPENGVVYREINENEPK